MVRRNKHRENQQVDEGGAMLTLVVDMTKRVVVDTVLICDGLDQECNISNNDIDRQREQQEAGDDDDSCEHGWIKGMSNTQIISVK